MFFPNRILCLDMGNHSYKYIEAQLSNKLQILRFGTCQEGQLLNSKFSNVIWKKLGCRSRDAILSFHHKSLITREFELIVENEFELQNIIKKEFQEYQTELKEEYDFDYIVQPHYSQTGIYLTKAAGISKSINREYINKAVNLTLRPIAVDIQINALIRVIKKLLEHNTKSRIFMPCLVLDLGYKSTTAALINTDEILALKCISFGCSMIDESSENRKKYLQEIVILCRQMIDHYIYCSFNEELKQGIVYGGGTYNSSTIACIAEQIPLQWDQLNYFHSILSEIPADMDLNLYANCLGSLYWKENTLEKKENSL